MRSVKEVRFIGRCPGCRGVVALNLSVETVSIKVEEKWGPRNKVISRNVAIPGGPGYGARVYYSDSLGLHFGARCLCGRDATFVAVRGKVSEHKCGGRCMASKGPACECACGGKNHGSSYSA